MGEGYGALNFTAGNTTLILGGTVSGHFRVDKTSPTVSISTDQSTYTQNGNAILTWSATDSGSTIQTTSVTVTAVGDGGCTIPTISFSTATGSQTLTGSQTQCAGPYTATITSTDHSGLQSSTTSTFNVQYPAGGSYTIPAGSSITTTSNTSGGTPSGTNPLVIIGIILFVTWLLAKK